MRRLDIGLEAKVYEFPEAGTLVPIEGAAGADWSAWPYLVVRVESRSPHLVPLRLDFEDARGGRLTAVFGVVPQVAAGMVFPLSALDCQSIFLARTPGRMKCHVMGTRVDPATLRAAWFGASGVPAPAKVTVHEAYLADVPPEPDLPERVLVDELGQATWRTWPGKAPGETALKAVLAPEAARHEPEPMAGRDRWGGWTGRRFDGTGFFRTEHDGRRWWLVDPDGHAFWSAGLDCVRHDTGDRVDDIERLFAWLPAEDGRFAEAWTGPEGRRPAKTFSFGTANLIRAFGDGWHEKWAGTTHRRMVDWGFNTVGNWSEPEFIAASGLPYVWQLAGFPATRETVFRDFPDVFGDEYRSAARDFADQLEERRDDPAMVGYFLRNEPAWAFAPDVNLGAELLGRPAPLASKAALKAWLSERYGGDARRLGEAWGMDYRSFDDLDRPHDPREFSAAALADLAEFGRRMVTEYTRVACEATRRADPNHLNLGMRYAWVSNEAVLAAADLFDVFTLNMYQMAPDLEQVERAARASGRPVLIGEFHFGAIDAGPPGAGLRTVATQAERGLAYRRYVELAAACPDLVGTHYFTLNDQPTLGRFDGECFQIGCVDICHQPYEPFLAGVRATHERLYEVADGRLEPYDEPVAELPRVGF